MHARFRVSRREKGPWKSVRLLVDTRSANTFLPRRLLVQLGARPRGTVSVRIPRGGIAKRDVAVVWVRYGGSAFPANVIVGERGDVGLMGFVTLEELLLEVDPKTQRLRRVKVHLLVPAVAA